MNSFVLLKNIMVFLGLAFAAALIHISIISTVLIQYNIQNIWIIYPILIFLSVITMIVVLTRYKKKQTGAANAYFIMAFVKMFLCIFFLMPWVLNKNSETTSFVTQFMIMFFILLLVEIILIARVLNGNQATK